MSHTEGKLALSPDLRWIIGANGNRLASTGGALTKSLDENEANARRLVACWNAMEGIDDPELWVAQMRFMDGDHTVSLDHIQELQKERDELVTALRSAKSHLDQLGVELASLGNEPDDFALPEIESVLARYPEKP